MDPRIFWLMAYTRLQTLEMMGWPTYHGTWWLAHVFPHLYDQQHPPVKENLNQ
ncbi:hypothetical protein SAMN02746041_02080 [Desulfacinum hydrothermale DSM 13146]|uniref:Uncharacterized protein n=1 Tax=Desulfacinum hydrothermale DSM 13146 TaxID=1121390 RepID=A0A1W1XL68_9BACT|nr:hypothetical protein SAMN02746041_02080 [Desulfacinum hydrothermale DSM 13146]